MEQKHNPELERIRKIQEELETAEAEKTLLSQPQEHDEDMSILHHMDMDEDDDDWL